MDTSTLKPHHKERYEKQNQAVKDKLTSMDPHEARGWLNSSMMQSIINGVNNRYSGQASVKQNTKNEEKKDEKKEEDTIEVMEESDEEIAIDSIFDF